MCKHKHHSQHNNTFGIDAND